MPLERGAFSGIDRLVADKYKSVDQLQEEKAQRLDEKLRMMGVKAQVVERVDPDTFRVQTPTGDVHTIRAGGGFDAPDSFWRNTPESQAKRKQQAFAYNQATGKPVDEITNEDLALWKHEVQLRSDEAGFNVGDDITYIPSEAPSKLEGDSRTIAEIYNKSNQQLSNLFDSPETNTAYTAPWNRDKRIAEVEQDDIFRRSMERLGLAQPQLGYDEAGNAVVVQQPDGFYTYGDAHGLTRSQIEQHMGTQKSHRDNWGDPGSLTNVAAGATAMFMDEVATPIVYAAFTFTEEGSSFNLNLNLRARIATYNNNVTKASRRISDEDLDRYLKITREGELDDAGVYQATAEDSEFFSSGKMGLIGKLEHQVLDNQIRYSKIQQASDEIRKEIHASNMDTEIKRGFDKIYEKEGPISAALWMVTEHPLHPLAKLTESLPVMLATFTGVGMGAIYSSRYMRAVTERRRAEGRELSDKEMNIAAAATVISVAAERMGAEVLFNKFPGLDKFAVHLATKHPFTSRILKPLLKIGGTAAVESVSEIITEGAEQYAAKQDMDQIAGSDLAYAGTIGAAGGGSIKVPSAAADLVRSREKELQREIDKLENKLATPDTLPVSETEYEQLATRIEEIDVKLQRYPDIGESGVRDRLQAERAELQDRIDNGKANPTALSKKHRERLEGHLDKLTTARGEVAPKVEKTPTEEVKITPEGAIDRANVLLNSEIGELNEEGIVAVARELIDIRQVLQQSNITDAQVKLAELGELTETIKNRITTLQQAPEYKAEQEKDEVLYSLDSLGNETEATNNIIASLQKAGKLSNEETELLNKRTKLNEANQKYQKSIAEVNQEVVKGGGFKKSFAEYIQDIKNRPLTGIANLANFVQRTEEKAKALYEAHQSAMSTGQSVFVKKDTLETTTSTASEIEGFWRIDPVPNNPLVNITQQEAEVGRRTLETAELIVESRDTKAPTEAAKRNSVIAQLNTELEDTAAKSPAGSVETAEVKKAETKQEKEATSTVMNQLLGKESVPESTTSKQDSTTETTTETTTEPEQTESVEGEVAKAPLDSELKTRAGFKRRFTELGVIEGGKLVSWEQFQKLDTNVMIAVAKSLKVCK